MKGVKKDVEQNSPYVCLAQRVHDMDLFLILVCLMSNVFCQCISCENFSFYTPSDSAFTPVAGPISGPLSTRLIEGFHFEDCLISRFYFVPNPSNLVSQVLLCARKFHTLNRGISFRRIQILLSSFWKRDRENVFYKYSNSGQMFLHF